MNTRVCLLTAVLMTASVHAAATTYYASPDGRGDGLSRGRPFTIANFWLVAKPGDVLLLLDGKYTGDDSMIAPPRGLSGAPGHPISVKAVHDGKVLIDGERQHLPVCLRGNAWFVLVGFNACGAGGRGNAEVIGLGGNASDGGSAHAVVRRVVAWDAKNDSNSCVWSLVNSDHVLLEDVAGFVVGRKIFVPFRCKHTTIRRAWGRWEGYHGMGPKVTFSLYYHSYHTIIENCIGTWSAERQKESYRLYCNDQSHPRAGQLMTEYAVDQPYGVFAADRIDPDDPSWFTRSKILGCIGYVRGTDKYQAAGIFTVAREGDIELRDNAAYIEPGTHPRVAPLRFTHPRNAEVAERARVHGFTAVGGSAAGPRRGVVTDDIEHGQTIAEASSIFTSPKGAQIAYRYVGGQLSDQPLWPWPMDQRIKEAIALAGRRSVTYGMQRDDGLVTSAIEQMFEPIPAELRLDRRARGR